MPLWVLHLSVSCLSWALQLSVPCHSWIPPAVCVMPLMGLPVCVMLVYQKSTTVVATAA